MRNRFFILAIGIMLFPVFMIACGGGGGGSSSSGPAAPTGIIVTGGAAQVSLEWGVVTGATSYNVYYLPYSATASVIKANGTQVPNTDNTVTIPLIRGTYYFIITAENANGEGSSSSVVSGVAARPALDFAQADLVGNWHVRVLQTGASPGWYGAEVVIDADGDVANGTLVAASTIGSDIVGHRLTMDSGDTTSGIITDGTNATFHGAMSSGDKNFIAATATNTGNASYDLYVFVRKGSSFSSSDLAGKSFQWTRMYAGGSTAREYARGTTNASGLMDVAYAELNNSAAGVTLPADATISVNATSGIVSIAGLTFSGVMSPDKKVIVGTSTDVGSYSMRIICLEGQTYSVSDLAGITQVHTHGSTGVNAGSWAYGTQSTSAAGDMEFTAFLNSSGSAVPPPDSTFSFNTVGGSGNVILASGEDHHVGVISYGKDLVASINSLDEGTPTLSTFEVKVQ